MYVPLARSSRILVLFVVVHVLDGILAVFYFCVYFCVSMKLLVVVFELRVLDGASLLLLVYVLLAMSVLSCFCVSSFR